MAFRAYRDRTPARLRSSPGPWPKLFIDPPARQFGLLAGKHRDREPGRIPLPRTSHELWAQHKHSVLAPSQPANPDLARRVGRLRGRDAFRQAGAGADHPAPSAARSGQSQKRRPAPVRYFDFRTSEASAVRASLRRTLGILQRRCRREGQPHLLAQTPLTELAVCLV